MKPSLLKRHKLFLIALALTLLHFAVSSIAVKLYAKQIGTEIGNIVGDGLSSAYLASDSNHRNANDIYESMKQASEKSFDRWESPLFLLSLPIGPLTDSFWKRIRRDWLYTPVLSKEISKSQFKSRGKLIEYLTLGTNSISFGLLLYILLKIFELIKSKTVERDALQ